jgi:hypothetical protein
MKTKTAGELGIQRLYNYPTFNPDNPKHHERLRQTLLENKVYCSSPKGFNDPWDCRPCFNEKLLIPLGIVMHISNGL